MSGILLIFSWGLATLPDEAKQQVWAEWLPLSFWSKEKGKENDLKWTVKLFDLTDNMQETKRFGMVYKKLPPFHRNLNLSAKLLIANTITPSQEQQLRRGLSNAAELKATVDNIRGLNLKGRDLRQANFNNALLVNAGLRDVNLQGAKLIYAKLQGADLSGANLQGAILYDANLQGAYLNTAKLQGANLSGANLRGANLSNANLRGANLKGALAYAS